MEVEGRARFIDEAGFTFKEKGRPRCYVPCVRPIEGKSSPCTQGFRAHHDAADRDSYLIRQELQENIYPVPDSRANTSTDAGRLGLPR
jgi:hypothetical protein